MSDYSLTTEEALSRLAVIANYDPGGEGGPRPCVHTFRDAPLGLIGAHWSIEDARAAMEEFGVAIAGPQATAAGHGVVVIDKTGSVFFETLPTEERSSADVGAASDSQPPEGVGASPVPPSLAPLGAGD